MADGQDDEIINDINKDKKSSLFKDIDKIIHEPNRLGIMTILYTLKKASFSDIKKELEMSDGNLFSHFKTLENARYISVIKTFIGRKPRTYYEITDEGNKAFLKHVKKLEKIISNI